MNYLSLLVCKVWMFGLLAMAAPASAEDGRVFASLAEPVAGCVAPLDVAVRLEGEAVALERTSARRSRGVIVRRGTEVTLVPKDVDVPASDAAIVLDFDFTYCVDLARPETAYDLLGTYRLYDSTGVFSVSGALAEEADTNAAEAPPTAVFSGSVDDTAVVILLPGNADWHRLFTTIYPQITTGPLKFEFEIARDAAGGHLAKGDAQ